MIVARRCYECNEDKPNTEFYLRPNYTGTGKARFLPYCIKCESDRKKRWREDNPEQNAVHHRKYRYGITKEDYEKRFKEQGNKCGICGTTDPGYKHGWHTDHDHVMDIFRGILCQQCNIRLDWSIKYQKEIKQYLLQK
jgi:hypothetical protein